MNRTRDKYNYVTTELWKNKTRQLQNKELGNYKTM